MRELVFSDVFTVIRILKKAGISDQARAIFSDLDPNASQKEIGAKFLFTTLENMGKVENEIAEFLGSMKGIGAEDVKKLGLDETAALLKELIDHEGFKRFLSSVSAFMK